MALSRDKLLPDSKQTETKRDDGWETLFELLVKCVTEQRSGLTRKAGEKGTAHLRTLCAKQAKTYNILWCVKKHHSFSAKNF